MSEISNDDVRQLAALSSLSLSDQEVEDLQQDMTSILEYISELSELDTSHVEPTYQVTGLVNRMRDDTICDEAVGRDELLTLAPARRLNQVEVPKVL